MRFGHRIIFAVTALWVTLIPTLLFAQYSGDTAASLTANGSASGAITAGHSENWWKITIPSDGKLVVSTLSDAALEIDTYILEKIGEGNYTGIATYDIGSGVRESSHRNDLKAGAYYVKVYGCSGSLGNYTITSTFTPASLENDVADNDSAGAAVTLACNGSDTGHLRYGTYNYSDTEDWWRIVIPSDGKLTVSTLSDSTLDIDTYLFEKTADGGYTSIATYDIGTGVRESSHRNDLRAGAYYVKVYGCSGYGSYTVTSTFTPASLENDVADNDSAGAAVTLACNGSDTGHLRYGTYNYSDTEDWWRIVIPSDGKLTVSTLSDSTLDIDTYLFEKRAGGSYVSIATYDFSYGVLESTHYDNLKPGDYYVRAYGCSGGYGSYTITSSFTPARYASDAEPNDTRETALSDPVQIVGAGHLGYYADTHTDLHDWRSFTVPAGWDSLFVRVVTDSTLEADANLYNAGGAQILHDGSWGVASTFSLAAPAAGTYTMDIYRYTGYGSYRFIVSNHGRADVPEPSGTGTLAPPSGFTVADIPNDQGNMLLLSWTLSPDESGGKVTRYRIYRSRSATMTSAVSRSQFATTDELNAWEAAHTVIVADSIPAGTDRFTDFVPLNGVSYYYWIQAVGPQGVSKMIAWVPGMTAVSETPREFRVSAPYPNPFNPSVTIGYTLPERMHVRLTVYDSVGRTVAVLEDGMQGAGVHSALWNGRSDRGETLGSGVYLYRVEAGSHHAQGKMTLLR